MLIDRLAASLSTAEPYTVITGLLGDGSDATLAAPGLIRPAVVAALHAQEPRPTLVVVSGEENAERFWRQTAAFLGQRSVLHYPERTDYPWSGTAPDLEQVGARARALYALEKNRPVIVVASARALLRMVPPQGSRVFDPLTLSAGATIDLEEASARLARMGYERVEVAENPGQFAVRGGILDVFPAGTLSPVRAELFGDEIESLKRYVPSTGQAIGDSESIEVFPCRELSIGSRGVEFAQKTLRDKALKDPFLAHQLELLEQGVFFNGIEVFLPLLYKRPAMPTEYLGPDVLTVVAEPRSLFDDAVRRTDEITVLAEAARVPLEGLYLSPAQLDFGARQRLTLLSIHRTGAGVDAELPARRPEVAGGEDRFVGGVRSLLSTGYAVALAVPDRRARRKISDVLTEAGVRMEVERDHAAHPEGAEPEASPLAKGLVEVADTDVPAGFVIADAKIAVVSIDDVYPRSAVRRARRQIDPTRVTFAFVPGDYVVHATHGIALFKEIVRQEVLGQERDYLLLEYAKGDKLYVPVEQIDRITKFVGPDSSSPQGHSTQHRRLVQVHR